MAHKVLWARTWAMPISLTSSHTCLLTHELLVVPPTKEAHSHSDNFSSSVFSSWDSFPRSPYDSRPYFIQDSAPMSTQRDLLGWPPQGKLPWSDYLKLLPLLHFLSPCLTLFLLQHLSRNDIEMILYICLSVACIRIQIPRGRDFAMLLLYPQA